ncbi:MAG: lysylphosphatidylglycerol synthase transmembrane domain-containing protein [Candidatus Pacebacteria bacterium]|nr:lysylphosphatidylglycerol synthase transmembrane domain-containing protein [Candidatus Paceibacterota bacterium]
MKKTILYFLRIVLTAAVVWYFFQKINLEKSFEAVKQADFLIFLSALAVSLIAWIFNSLRWRQIFLAANINMPAKKLFLYNLVGVFYGVVLPGGKLTGDAVCAHRLTEDNSENGYDKRYFLSILMDRAIGMLTMIFFVSVYFIFKKPFYNLGWQSDAFGYFLLAADLLGFILIFTPVFGLVVSKIIKLFASRWSLLNNIESITQVYGQNKRRLYPALLFSIAGVSCLALSVYLLSLSVGLGASFGAVGFSYLLATILIVVPITIGGIGLREGGITYFLIHLGAPIDGAAALSILMFAQFAIVALIGGAIELYFVVFKKALK